MKYSFKWTAAIALSAMHLGAAAQFTCKTKADSIKIVNNNHKIALLLNNSTKDVTGYLFNYKNERNGTTIILPYPVYCLSDIRLKENVTPEQPALDKLLRLSVIDFSYKYTQESKATRTGLIAQEVEQQFPLLVTEQKNYINNDSTAYKAVNYLDMVAVLVKALQEEDQKVATLQQEVADLKKKMP
ncbi:tail fiber domain-containing protein [Deminuibacter soli]|uniref:Tail fiber domain-containing protein n=1 Tax=Deminuibacter soli TaxID=2291815 RepID=A0A3E1NJ37_9BACT|nr:tail fiber domain-containing protein [Deminuibacter soli]RFM27946.1 tail fiber domain-containing protein [Deminuibacter soli]